MRVNHLQLGFRGQAKSTGAVDLGLMFLLLAFALVALPGGVAHAATQSTLNVTGQDSTGASLSGYYTALYDSSGNVVATGYLPMTYTLNDGQSYVVEVDGYGNCNFDHWADTGSTNYMRTISISANTQITAVYNCGTSGGGGGSSSLTVASVDSNNNPLTGYYAALFDSSGNTVGTGFTTHTFTTTSGASYKVEVDGYGSCSFAKWSDGVSSNPRTFTATTSALTFTAVYNCGTSGGGGGGSGSSVTVNSVDSNNNPISGYYVGLLDSSGNTLSSGFTTVTFTTTSGTAYQVQASGYGTCAFTKWSDGIVNNPRAFTATTTAMTFTAVYNCGGSGGGSGGGGSEGGAGPGTITIYDHRIPASYWADCFATTCTNPLASCDTSCTGPGASMWVVLYDSAGNVVGSGFADENGHTFTGLSPTATYYLYPSDCDLCHSSTHDVLFNNWGSGSTTRPLPVVANGGYYDAWYTCTNGCGGG